MQPTSTITPGATAAPTPLTLRGRKLRLAQAAWLAVALPTIGLYLSGVHVYFASLLAPCPDAACTNGQLTPDNLQALHAFGLSVGFYASYTVALDCLVAAGYSAVAILLFWRKSTDPMALFTALALLTFGTATFTSSMQVLADVAPEWWLPVQVVGFIGDVSMLTFLYLFPDGHFVPRWSRWLALLWLAYQVPAYFAPQSRADLSGTGLGAVIFPSLLASGVAAQVYRYRWVASLGQRQQTKWVVFGVVVGVALDLTTVAVATSGILPWRFEPGSPAYFLVLTVAFFALLLIPLSIGVAILRARLWDIDIIIRRTLVYSSLSGVLLLVYGSSVVLLQAVLRPLFGQQSPQLVTVASTLVIAALFSPLRRRIQTVIDQRFYRRRYNAAQILAAFGATMRDKTDLDALVDELLVVVKQTMQPSHVSLWLRKWEPRAPSERQGPSKVSGHVVA